jgi:hypothetical protein
MLTTTRCLLYLDFDTSSCPTSLSLVFFCLDKIMVSTCSSPERTHSVRAALGSKIKDQIYFSGLFFALIHFIAFGVAMLVFHVAKQDNGD